jgi:hypothetical protein
MDESGAARALHSLVDPEREGRRLAGETGAGGFLVFLGLGGAYHIRAALEREETAAALGIDYGADAAADLLRSMDYAALFADPRFHLLVDASGDDIESAVLALYQPALAGGIRTLPLRQRTESDTRFAEAAAAVKRAIEKVTADYSVQAHFGGRWFANIIRNILAAGDAQAALPRTARARHTAIAAAGPSLDAHLPLIREQRERVFLLAVDTSLPALLSGGIPPDAVVSIDCQHISYSHFMSGLPRNTLLFLDLASPPLLASLSPAPRFFSGGHPFAQYVSRNWRAFPAIDASGGNVTYAALSLAETLGAETVTVFGADFSYPQGRTYAKGAYIVPLFAKRQNRLLPLEAQVSAFLYRSPLEKKGEGASWFYETARLRFYRERFEEKAAGLAAAVSAAPGLGARLYLERKTPARGHATGTPHEGPPARGAEEFLAFYRGKIEALNPAVRGPELLTLLPLAAALKRNRPELNAQALVEAAKAHAAAEIDKALEGHRRNPAPRA